MELTPQAVEAALKEGAFLRALVMAFRLNEKEITQAVYGAVPHRDIKLVVRQLPTMYVPKLLAIAAELLEKGPRLEFGLLWIREALMVHGRWIRERTVELASVLRQVNRALVLYEETVLKLWVLRFSHAHKMLTRRSRRCNENTATLSYIIDQSKRREAETDRMQVE
ncbi:hypothetical protein EWM64_g10452 [Hericium alpestre]|uniref:Small-subunit processome Utp12 domain-containing protein n=1 Tax=Hericium alpestre TaxID=135208 RepID=A0A4Y9ZIB9_9AGAM|nr:hypothetical protein EWM64_g10452 [Hericium alpestre]